MADESLVEDHLSKAEGYLMLGLHEDALSEAVAAFSLDPESYDANLTYGVVLIALERFDEADTALTKTIELDPDRPLAYVHLAYVHRRTISLDKAIETISLALERQPGMALANYNLACYYALKGDTEEALRFLGRAINLAPDFREAARTDEDFASLQTNDRFRRIVDLE
jgi:tetratricopeptide (TPR) repeat protein